MVKEKKAKIKEEELTEEEKKAIKEAIEDIKKRRVRKLEEFVKELGLKA